MVGSHYVNAVFGDGIYQYAAIKSGLNCRITFNTCAKLFVHIIAECDMRNTYFGGYFLFTERGILE